MRPIDVNKENEQRLLYSVYKNVITDSKYKFAVGDYVRISKYKGIFSKGYEPNWSTEIFLVIQVHPTVLATYTLKDLEGNVISGAFYELELQKAKYKDFYLVEKVLRKNKNKLYVKWLGFDKTHNSWINKKELDNN